MGWCTTTLYNNQQQKSTTYAHPQRRYVYVERSARRRRRVAYPQRYANAHHSAWRVTLYPSRLQVRPETDSRLVLPPKGGRRGVIRRFSIQSRRRLMRFMASVSFHRPLFATLTYPFPVDAAKLKRDLDRFGKSFVRRFPTGWFVWRIERTRRGRWHIHMIISGVVHWHWQDMAAVWLRSIGAKDARWIKTMTDISAVRNPRAVMAYAGKYLGKINKYDDALNKETGEIEDVGRFWGIIGRRNVEYVSVSVYLPYHSFMAFRRVLRRLYKLNVSTLTRRNIWHSIPNTFLRWLRQATGNDHLDFITEVSTRVRTGTGVR